MAVPRHRTPDRARRAVSSLDRSRAAPAGGRARRGLGGLLEIGNSIITYRARYQRQPELLPVIDLLVLDESNPHAVGFQLDASAVRSTSCGSAGFPPVNDPRPLVQALHGFDLARFEDLRLPFREQAGKFRLWSKVCSRAVSVRTPCPTSCRNDTSSTSATKPRRASRHDEGPATQRYRVKHHTVYRYQAPVTLSHQRLHLTPRPLGLSSALVTYEVIVTPVPTDRRDLIDSFGNPVTEITIESPHAELDICRAASSK